MFSPYVIDIELAFTMKTIKFSIAHVYKYNYLHLLFLSNQWKNPIMQCFFQLSHVSVYVSHTQIIDVTSVKSLNHWLNLKKNISILTKCLLLSKDAVNCIIKKKIIIRFIDFSTNLMKYSISHRRMAWTCVNSIKKKVFVHVNKSKIQFRDFKKGQHPVNCRPFVLR
jgi:hypothetical protein